MAEVEWSAECEDVAGGVRRSNKVTKCGRVGLLARNVRDRAFPLAAGGGVELLWNAAREVALTACGDGVAHGVGHEHGFLCVRDSCVEQDAIGAEFHRDADVARASHACVNDDGIRGVALFEEFEAEQDVVAIQDALAAADGAAGGHDAGGASFFDSKSGDWIVAGVRENFEAFFDEFARGFNSAHGVGEERFFVAQHFEFDPACAGVAELLEDVAAEERDADGIARAEAAGGVGQDGVAFGVDEFEEAFALVVVKAFAADGDGCDFAAAGREGVAHGFVRGVFASAGEEAAVEGAGADVELGVGGIRDGGCGHGGLLRHGGCARVGGSIRAFAEPQARRRT